MFNYTLPLHKTTPSSVIQSFSLHCSADISAHPPSIRAALQWDRLGNVPEATQIQYQNQSVSPSPAPGSVSMATVHPITFQSLPHSLFLSLSETVRVTAVLYQSHSKDITIPSHGSQILHTQLKCRRWERAGYRQPPLHKIQMWNACNDSTRHDALQHHYYYIAV